MSPYYLRAPPHSKTSWILHANIFFVVPVLLLIQWFKSKHSNFVCFTLVFFMHINP